MYQIIYLALMDYFNTLSSGISDQEDKALFSEIVQAIGRVTSDASIDDVNKLKFIYYYYFCNAKEEIRRAPLFQQMKEHLFLTTQQLVSNTKTKLVDASQLNSLWIEDFFKLRINKTPFTVSSRLDIKIGEHGLIILPRAALRVLSLDWQRTLRHMIGGDVADDSKSYLRNFVNNLTKRGLSVPFANALVLLLMQSRLNIYFGALGAELERLKRDFGDLVDVTYCLPNPDGTRDRLPMGRPQLTVGPIKDNGDQRVEQVVVYLKRDYSGINDVWQTTLDDGVGRFSYTGALPAVSLFLRITLNFSSSEAEMPCGAGVITSEVICSRHQLQPDSDASTKITHSAPYLERTVTGTGIDFSTKSLRSQASLDPRPTNMNEPARAQTMGFFWTREPFARPKEQTSGTATPGRIVLKPKPNTHLEDILDLSGLDKRFQDATKQDVIRPLRKRL